MKGEIEAEQVKLAHLAYRASKGPKVYQDQEAIRETKEKVVRLEQRGQEEELVHLVFLEQMAIRVCLEKMDLVV